MTTPQVRAFGATEGPLALYFHGTPGGALEAQWLHAAAQRHGIRLVALERASLAPGLEGDAYLQALAEWTVRMADGQPAALVGFSIGAHVALRVARALGPSCQCLLVSAAAPLEWPPSWEGMGAGRHTFQLARRHPQRLARIARFQGALARQFPGLLTSLLFQGIGAQERRFARQQRPHLKRLLASAFADGPAAYLRDLLLYCQPWADELAAVEGPVTLWHGEDDRWAPPGMARGLQQHLRSTTLNWLPELGHYGALLHCADDLIQACRF
ncbi:pimeloyl-ACP methyl ester carboxylesterase [Pseudomonas alcaligenes]|nr:pimeloyl-ACP methyl ester carboxylesterase [Pseudomonas alcaligenes]